MIANAIHTEERGFEELYLALRHKEGRFYSDEELLQLPSISKEHPHAAEWRLRKRSCDRLVEYLGNQPGGLKILEAGCGNGWLSRRLSVIPGSDITGMDINQIELQQAIKLFKSIPNLQFRYGDIEHGNLMDGTYDHIVFAASIQYFSSLKDIISYSFRKLKPNGELHILDSPFYKDKKEREAAEKRTTAYYTRLGFPRMTEYYFQHTMEDLYPFRYKIMYRPSFFKHHILNNKNPFPWLLVKKPAS